MPRDVHGLLECHTVFAPFNGIDLHADNLHAIFLQNAGLSQFCTRDSARFVRRDWEAGHQDVLFNYL